ncbi:hypothetical protein AVEN_64507-1 [Araneus ventricosus]|uniref:Uncharacterized protein n=1 Tax=Araneus ventricosus TaxID=182803 RepID=A0A4Y2TBN7_ARAVE|nr:hypothetical protein AVEN_64507-1 [Araneus ventricosus]
MFSGWHSFCKLRDALRTECNQVKIQDRRIKPKVLYHGKSLPNNVSLTVGKGILQGYVWECRRNGSDLVDKLADEMWDLKSTGIFLISPLGTEIRIYPDDSM